MSDREDSRPAYLKDKAGHHFAGDDLPNKHVESVDSQMDRLILEMPEDQRVPVTGKVRDVEWLLRGEPRPVQVEALRRSYHGYWKHEDEHDENQTAYNLRDTKGAFRTDPARGFAYFMEQRLGKTPVLLNEFGLLRRDYGVKWGVVYAPSQFKAEWGDEADRFGLDCPTHVFSSDDIKSAQRWVDRNSRTGGMVAINYETLQSRNGTAFVEQLAGDNSLIAWDESVSLKNANGTMSDNAIQMGKKFGFSRDLTGKPVVQGPHDLWAQLRAIKQISGWNATDFKMRYCRLGGFHGKKTIGVKRPEELYELLVSVGFLARRTKWLKTPGVEYYSRKVEMLPEQKVHYRRMEEDFLVELARDGFDPVIIAAEQIVTKMLKLQQIASGFIIDEDGTAHDIMPPRVNPKLQTLKHMLTNEIESKTIVFVHHTHSVDLIMQELQHLNPALICGNAQQKKYKIDSQEEKRRFNGDPSCRVMVGQSLAIRYGHTLMGSPDDPCLNEFYYENSYDLNTRSQTEERAQGKGQVGQISIGDFSTAKIEDDAIAALRRKEDISSAVLNYARETGLLPH